MANLTQLLTAKTINGFQTTAGAAEEDLLLSLDGAVAAASLAVAAGSILAITDLIPAAAAAARFRLQQSNDAGVTWFDVLVAIIGVNGCPDIALNSPIKITGGAAVLVRARVETPGGAAAVSLAVRAIQEP